MLVRQLILAAVLCCALSCGAVGCGNQSESFGFQTFGLTSAAPNPVPGMIPTPVVITGGSFNNLVGLPAQVTFTADGGATPFNGGTTAIETVAGTITSPSTIAVTTPAATICGPTSITATVGVTLPSGVFNTSGPGFITFLAPVLATVTNPTLGGTAFDAAVVDPVTITGANFGDVGGTVDVFWRSTPAGAGPLLFDAGASMTTKTAGTVVDATTITTTSPPALVCGAAITTQPAEIHRVDFRDGSCTPAAGPLLGVTFRAPRLTAVTNTGIAPYLGTTGPAMFAAAVPESYTIAGTGFGPVGGTVNIAWNSAAGALIYEATLPSPLPALPAAFGSSATVTVTGTITSRTAITATASPAAAVCGVAMDAQNLVLTMPDGSCSPSTIDGLGAANQVAPTYAAIANADFGGLANTFESAVAEPFEITGTDFGPVGGTAIVRWTSNTAMGMFNNGGIASPFVDVPATILSRTLIRGISPEAPFLCPVLPVANIIEAIDLEVVLQGGSCTALAANATMMQSPNPTAVTVSGLSPGPLAGAGGVPSTLPIGVTEQGQITITGFAFGQDGDTVSITLTDAAGGMPFNGAASVTIPGRVVNRVQIISDPNTFPTITTPRLAANVTAHVTVRILEPGLLAGGTCGHALNAVVFTAPPTITAIVNTDAAGAAIPSSLVALPGGAAYQGCHASTMTITGTGFDAATPTATTVYDLVSGVGPVTGTPPLAPRRRIGTNAPAGSDLGSAATTPAFAVTPVSIAGRVRLEGLLPDLDHDNNGLVTMRVRVQNPDGQFHETGPAAPALVPDPIWSVQSRPMFVGNAPNRRNDNDVAIDPSSLLAADDFAANTEGAGGLDNANMTVVSNDAPNLGVQPFDGTGLSVQYTRDGGLTWVDASGAWTGAALGAIDGFPAGAFRNHPQCEYDRAGTLWVSYLVDDPVGGNSVAVLGTSADQGATFAGVTVTATLGLQEIGPPSLAVGPSGPGAATDQVWVVFVDRSGGMLGDVIGIMGQHPIGGIVAAPLPHPLVNGRDEAECAIGPDGQVYVAWTEPGAVLGTTDVIVDVDADSPSLPTFGFNPAGGVLAATTPDLFVGNPASPDGLLTLGPNIDLAVAQTGTRRGRLVLAYDAVFPADGIVNLVDRQQVVTKHSDDDGATWPVQASIVHQVDNAFQFIPAIASDPATGRFYVTWYDTRNSVPNTGYDRYSAASNDGTSWGTDLRLSWLGVQSQIADGDTDFGFYAGVSAFRGCVLAGWTAGPLGPLTQDPAAAIYQQNANSSP